MAPIPIYWKFFPEIIAFVTFVGITILFIILLHRFSRIQRAGQYTGLKRNIIISFVLFIILICYNMVYFYNSFKNPLIVPSTDINNPLLRIIFFLVWSMIFEYLSNKIESMIKSQYGEESLIIKTIQWWWKFFILLNFLHFFYTTQSFSAARYQYIRNVND